MKMESVKRAIEELERQRHLIDAALEALRALDSGESEPVAPAGKGKLARSRAVLETSFSCSKHPEATEFSKRGVCKLCRSEFMKDYWRKKKSKENGNSRKASAASAAKTAAAESPDGSKFVYSQRQRCPKCGAPTRFFRPADPKPHDNWICMESGCELKIANYRIPADRDYDGDPGMVMSASA